MEHTSRSEHLRSTLTRPLANFPEILTSEHITKIAEVAGRLVSIESLTRLQAALRDDPIALKAAAGGSYFHDNSFLKLIIMDSICSRFRFRLHWWKADAKNLNVVQNIHNHQFHFYSFVLMGALTNTVWNAASQGASYVHYKYHPRSNRNTYLLTEVGTKFLCVNGITHQPAGNMYYLNAESLHTSDPDKGKDVVTLFIEDRVSIRLYADVFSNRYTGKKIVIPSPALSKQEYIDGLSDFILMLTKHEPCF